MVDRPSIWSWMLRGQVHWATGPLVLCATACLLLLAAPSQGQEVLRGEVQRGGQTKQAAKERRVALIIGNSNYRAADTLKNPVADAAQMQITLQRLGFELIVGQDASLDVFREKVAEFTRAIRNADIALFFYAGHGVQYGDKNYLLPTDIELTSEAEVTKKSVALNDVLDVMAKNAKTSVVFLDACRDSPRFRSQSHPGGPGALLLKYGKGLAAVTPSTADLFVGFAAAPGTTAKDGAGQNSPFTRALLTNLPRANVTISDMWTEVRAAVLKETNRGQSPEARHALSRLVYLNPNGTGTVEAPVSQGPETPSPTTPNVSLSDDAEFWVVIKDSSNPEDFRDYLQRFPTGRFTKLANRKLDELKQQPPTPGPTGPPVRPSQPSPDPERLVFPGAATVSVEHPQAEAMRNAKNLARARAIATKLSPADAAKLPPFVASSSDAGELQRWLERGLTFEETWTMHAVTGNEVRVELRAKVKPLELSADRKLTARVEPSTVISGQPIRIKLSARRDTRIGVYAWQADGTVLRLYPSTTQGHGIDIKAGDTVTLPRANDPYPNISSATMPGQPMNHEAIVVVASSKATTRFDQLVPLTITNAVRQNEHKQVEEAAFFASLAQLADPELEVHVLPYIVRAAQK